MIPVPNVYLAKIAWSYMAQHDCHPCGVLAYHGDDSSEVEKYVRGGGMIAADGIFRAEAGKGFAFIATAHFTPHWLDDWLAYAQAENLLWWQWFGASFDHWSRRHRSTQNTDQRSTPYSVTIIEATAEATAGPTTSASGGATVATQVTTEASDPDPVQNTAQPAGQSATPAVVPSVDEIKDELLDFPDDLSGLTRSGQRVPRGHFGTTPAWPWYYQGASRIAEYVQIDMVDIPCLKICDSTRDRQREQFPLSAVGSDRMSEFLTQIAINPKFKGVFQAYRPVQPSQP